MDFKVKSANSYASGCTRYNLPLEIGCYSLNADGKFYDDNHQMKYLAMPDKLTNLHLDLNYGYRDYIDVHEDTEHGFNCLLRWIILHEDVIARRFAEFNSKIDFVCGRSVFAAVSPIIYDKKNDWKILATKYKSVIYMAVERKKCVDQWIQDMGEKGERMLTWGFKFEQYMTTDEMNSRPDTSVPVNENENYFSIMKCKLNDYRFLLHAEMDCVDPEHFTTHGHDPTSILRYVELKTSRIIENERQNRNFLRYKLLKWYLQSYFTGGLRVLCGYRDDDGIVRNLVNYNVRDMPEMAKGLWCPTSCLNFCSSFFNHIKNCGMKDDPRMAYRIIWKPGSDNITIEEYPNRKNKFLPDWYIKHVKVI